MLDDLIDSLREQVYDVVVVANNWGRSQPANLLESSGLPVIVAEDGDDRNISRWWNIGLDLVAQHAAWLGDTEWNVAVLNDDTIVPPGWVDALSAAMRSTTAVLAYPDQCGGQQQILHTKAEPVDLRQRITGYAYMLRGEAGLRLDESMAWWYSDDSLDWEAREKGGSLLVPGIPVQHRCPNESTEARPELQEQAARDRETFIAKHGKAPH
ncbi:glycosyltransferase family 2 protein [Streptomyces sp. NPDC056352]|uniref:glycosyltransferase family 2 protein n=1 Tax=Streptomyces sp. NPDC056352 TaxID=3345791 RepID=UPI0035E04970